ncbi:two-component system, chemotaxis family, CheB/CheR fusion protein [Massilia sp. PDC64]|nr:CheR family methyltransferase [Massilia sp. PDC64]SDE87760.1 two-component system, chemotaxis family, CheB/CheR fusion protein [Massilia sp. PDC64]
MSDMLETAANEALVSAPYLPYPVVGIGASAGGLPALLRLFEEMPAHNGMAFVVVLHLSPKHQSNADQLLQRATRMPVLQVTESVKIEPDHVYVIAPSKQLTMMDGSLTVAEMQRPRGQHIAIDAFFRTLAEAQRERAVALVLSGTGGDGAVGIARVKEEGGVIIVQHPGDAEHDGMPLAAIGTGLVDFVLPIVEMPQKLIDLWQNAKTMELPPAGPDGAPASKVTEVDDSTDAEQALQRVLGLLRAQTGHDFRQYKRATVLRRIERRMQVRAMHSLPEYVGLLEADPGEHKLLLNDLLIGVTNFFRDREAFETLERDIIPAIFRDRKAGDEVRAWVAGCATGEEAYSLAMLLADQAALTTSPPSYQVFASDIDEHAIAIARTGMYPTSIVTDVTPARLRQHFTRDENRYQIRKAVRDRILFAVHNLLRDPPFSRIDLISCRNLLIYLNRDIQQRVLETFHFALKPGGYLFLGSSESAESVDELFVPVDKKNRIYRSRASVRTLPYHRAQHTAPAHLNLPEPRALAAAARRQASLADVHQRALAQFAPPSVVVDLDHNVVHMSERAAQYMRLVGGEPSRDILALVLPELRIDLRSALYQVQNSGVSVEGRQVSMVRNGRPSIVSVTVRPFHDDEASQDFLLVMFSEVERSLDKEGAEGRGGSDDVVLSQLEAELQRKKQQLQETIEHAEVSNEELRAANEELQAINEELRSATEELETSKEELQSVNEELITVNYELKIKVEETGKANDDLNNLIASTDIATIFVDSAMRIKRSTPRAADIFSIIPSDMGRSLLDLTHRLDYKELADDVALTFNTLRMVEREVRSHDGRYYIVRLLPYRTTEDRIEGAVMTFFDITGRREAEEKLRAGEARMRLVAESTKDYAIITMDSDGRVTSWNRGAERMFGYREDEVAGRNLEFLFLPEEREQGAPAEEMERARREGRALNERWHVRKDGSLLFCSGEITQIESGEYSGYAMIARDETQRMRHDRERDQSLSTEQRGRSDAESASALKDEFLAVMAHELRHPLNLIQISVELLARLPELRQVPAVARSANVIRNAVQSQAKLIDDLLDMSRVRTGKLALALAPLDLAPLVRRAVDAVRAAPGGAGLAVTVESGEAAVPVLADDVRIEQVVMNLLGNAVKFTPPGGTIAVRVDSEDGMARIDVTDSGQGIAPDQLPRVFEMYAQPMSVTRAKGGLGIGLAVVRDIVALHGGRVEAYSEGVGKGARFTVWLPLAETGTIAPDAGQAGPAHDIAGVRILFVDGAQDVVTTCQALLELQGAVVTGATSARQALAVVAEADVDVLVAELAMPDMDGHALLQAVRALPRHAGLPAIAIGGLAREQDIAEARASGFNAHLGKPLSVERLTGIIRDLLPARAD